jgi:hypothetical protein
LSSWGRGTQKPQLLKSIIEQVRHVCLNIKASITATAMS